MQIDVALAYAKRRVPRQAAGFEMKTFSSSFLKKSNIFLRLENKNKR